MRVQSLVWEIRSHMPHNAAKTKNHNKNYWLPPLTQTSRNFRKYSRQVCEERCIRMVVGHYFFLICFLNLSEYFLSIYYFWLHWVLVAAHRLPLVAESRGYSGCGAWASHCSDISCYTAHALGHTGFRSCGPRLVALRHVGSSWTRDRTHVLCISRWISNHWTTREVLS